MNHNQRDVLAWVRRTFGESFLNDQERALRFIEEACELVQAVGLTLDDVKAVAEHVYDRPVGDPEKEIGGVYITLEALAEHKAIPLQWAANREWDRICVLSQKHFDAASQRKQDAGICHIMKP